MISYNMTATDLNVFVQGEMYTVPLEDCGKEVWEILNNPSMDDMEQELVDILDRIKGLDKYTEGSMEIVGHSVYYNGKQVENGAVEKLLSCKDQGLPYRPLLKFLEKLMQNQRYSVIKNLYAFLEHKGMQISGDGMIVGWKGVRENYMDVHSGTVLNKPGCSPEPFSPQDVDDNPEHHCSYGYHVGSFSYARSWGPKVMRVCVNPKDVICVPNDCACQKIRCTGYTVLEEVTPEDTQLRLDEVAPVSEEDIYGASRVADEFYQHFCKMPGGFAAMLELAEDPDLPIEYSLAWALDSKFCSRYPVDEEERRMLLEMIALVLEESER